MKAPSDFVRQNNMNKAWGFDFVDLTCMFFQFLHYNADVTFIRVKY
jgi:hypothetical protein